METIYFGQNLRFLRKSKEWKLAEIQSQSGFSPTQWSNWELGNSFPKFSDLIEISKQFGITESDLIHQNLEIGNPNAKTPTGENAQKGNLIGNPLGNLKAQNDPQRGYLELGILPQNQKKYDSHLGMPQVITVDSFANENIVHVPVRAQAGYLIGYGDREYISSLQTYSLPGLRGKTFRSFEVEGLSMKPTLNNRDWVVGEWLENLADIRENRVHIIVTKNDGILIKRVLNRLSERGKLYLKSDAIQNRADYPTIELDPSEVAEIWYARMRFGTDFSEPGEIFRKVDDLEIRMMEVMKRLQIK